MKKTLSIKFFLISNIVYSIYMLIKNNNFIIKTLTLHDLITKNNTQPREDLRH